MKKELNLHYALSFGSLEAHATGLREGRAVAAKCVDCGFVSFPPLTVCTRCGTRCMEKVDLSGVASIQHATGPAGRCFGLVRFEGSDTACVARLVGFANTMMQGRLIPSQGDSAGIWLGPINQGAERKN